MEKDAARLLKAQPGLFALAGVMAIAAVQFGAPIEFALFAMTLAGVALFHDSTLRVVLIGLVVVTSYEFVFTGFKTGPGIGGLVRHFGHEWVTLANLLGLLMGFALLSKHFEESRIPEELPRFLPDDWKGGFVLLAIVFVLSAFLDNIAAALIGGAIAHAVFRGNVHVGYLAGIVAAANAGGAGSVVGDTTTTMMWIAGVSPLDVLHAYVAAVVALVVCGIPAAIQQHRFAPIKKERHAALRSTGCAFSSWSSSSFQRSPRTLSQTSRSPTCSIISRCSVQPSGSRCC